jgi:TetR/AcrR family transcriptional regulator
MCSLRRAGERRTVVPRAFNDDEIGRIRTSLLRSGRVSFLERGLKGTTIHHLITSAGIGKGSFYQFFESKEDLFLELFSEDIPAMMTRLYEASFGKTDDTREALVRLMKAMIHELETNQVARVVLNDPAQLERFLSTEEFEILRSRIAEANTPIVQCIERAQVRGEIIGHDSRQIAEILGMVKHLVVHRERTPPALYHAMCESYPEVIADGLTCPVRRM